MAKIVIPTNPKKLLELTQKILDKHLADGESSPLNLVITDSIQQTVTDGLQLNTQAETLEKQMEKAYEERDEKVKEAAKIVKQSRDILKGVYTGNLKQLGDYGFTVND